MVITNSLISTDFKRYNVHCFIYRVYVLVTWATDQGEIEHNLKGLGPFI